MTVPFESDIFAEGQITLQEAALLARVSFVTVWRWALKGTRPPDGGPRVRLEALRIGGKWWTSKAALRRFADRLTQHADGTPMTSPRTMPRTAPKRARAIKKAEAELQKAGI
jgi:hypothetical protein